MWGKALRSVPVVADADVADERPAVFLHTIESYSLSLAQEAEHAALQGTGSEVNLILSGVENDDTGLSAGVVSLDETLHDGWLSLLDFAGFEAGGAYTHPLRVGTVANADALDVGGPAAVGALVREGDLLAEARLFVADFTAIGHR